MRSKMVVTRAELTPFRKASSHFGAARIFSNCTAACMAGAVCGDHCSPISDTTIIAFAGAQCDHVNHVPTQLALCHHVRGSVRRDLPHRGHPGQHGCPGPAGPAHRHCADDRRAVRDSLQSSQRQLKFSGTAKGSAIWPYLIKNDAQNPKISGSHRKMKPM